MTISYTIDLGQQTVFSTFTGHVTNAEIIAHQNELRSDPKFNPDMFELMDCIGEVSVDHIVANVIGLVDRSPWGRVSRRAIIAPDPLIFGRSKIFQAYISHEHGNVSVFRGMNAARKWLYEGEGKS
ncbi:hypothetical protein [Mariprofundus sp. EBB-1]|uniref:hypothetical protein n=1 Tax=Mariprofundus sp. EBB-1 TaxID=2650971 RepID=UPI000EF21977|nr:hypothetical protein [Mariprofundus sp. EBB-1]